MSSLNRDSLGDSTGKVATQVITLSASQSLPSSYILQAATSIQEMTLSFIPKLAVMVVALVLFGEWQLALMVDYFEIIFERIQTLAF
mgnify:CR=1 FL=1